MMLNISVLQSQQKIYHLSWYKSQINSNLAIFYVNDV